MEMSSLEVWLIIILVIGVIASNLAVLKYSAKFKMPQFGQHSKDKQIKRKGEAAGNTDKAPSTQTDGKHQDKNKD
ncbi:MAG: hypothetical protein Sw1PiTSA_17870 [Shewanella algae]|jgi:hypothetical protein|uniref:DUF2897 family protein n=2 Tax=Shewanellaceae TaxID=267890 RepID=A0AAD1KAC3_9GAMM|nr:hypothetical protein TUM17379_23010 [Shewanella algae]